MADWGSSAAIAGLVVEAVEWLPSGADSGLVRVRGRWSEEKREDGLPALGLRRADEARRFDSLPDARFGRDPGVWRGTYLVPSALMDPAPDELWLSWESGARAALPAPARGFEPPATPAPPPAPEPGGEVIDRAVLAERRARRAEAAERAQAERAAEALKAVEVLELRSAELERRLEALQSEPPPQPAERSPVDSAAPSVDSSTRSPAESVPPSAAESAPPPAAASSARDSSAAADLALPRSSPPSIATSPDATAGALAEAVGNVKRLRHELDEQRQRLRRSELLRAADAVALASFGEEEGRARRLEAQLAARERKLAEALATAEASAADATTARKQAAEQVSLAAQRAAADAAAVRSRAAEELGGVRAQLATVRRDAEQRAAQLERRLAELEAALNAERRAHGVTATERETARAGLALAESARGAESVARAALDEELDRERAARAALSEELAAARKGAASAEASLRAEFAAVGERARSAEAARDAAIESEASSRQELAAASSARAELAVAVEQAASAEASVAELRSQLDAAQARIGELERELAAGRGALDSAGREAGGLLARIAELERAADDDLERRAREQATASSSVARSDGDESRDVAANLDAAAAALRARPPTTVQGEPAAVPAPAASGETLAQDAPAGDPPPAQPPAAERSARPRIVTESKHPPRAGVVGTSRREYPWLRGALVKLAHDDPRSATRFVLGLVPVQRALVEPPLEYDLTIRGSGTYAISITDHAAAARSIGAPRPRHEVSFHASADIVTLAELVAGIEKRMGRWIGSVKVQGKRRHAEAVRKALAGAGLDLAAAARAGADLDPDLVFRAFAYAIHPSWTKGHTFTVAQEIAGPRPMRWHVGVRDGAPVSVERRAPPQPPDAVVSMTREAFSHLLRCEQAPSGERPTIRGDRDAVALLKAWTDRAQGR